MSASNNPQISYHEPETGDIEDYVSDTEEDEYYMSGSQGTKKRKRAAPVSTQKSTKAEIFPWADLPGELKNTIYRFALVEERPFFIKAGSGLRHDIRRVHVRRPLRRSQRRPPLALGLLLVDKNTHREAVSIFYSKNCFDFDSWRAMFFFLRPLSPHTKNWIRSIQMRSFTWHMGGWVFPTMEALIGATKLQRLEFLLAFGGMRTLYKHSYNWIDAVGKQRDDKFAALQILRGLSNSQLQELRELIRTNS